MNAFPRIRIIKQNDMTIINNFYDNLKIKCHLIFLILLRLIKDKNNIKCLIIKKYLLDLLSHDLIFDIACEIGDVILLQYSYKNLRHIHDNRHLWYDGITMRIAKNGHIACLKYAHENGCPWDDATTKYAAQNGHMNCLKYAHENGCPWDDATTKYAAENEHIDCLIYALENGCPWHPDTQKYLKKRHQERLNRTISRKRTHALKSILKQ